MRLTFALVGIGRIRGTGECWKKWSEEVDSGLIHSAENVYTEYEDQRRDEWETKVRPALNNISLAMLQKGTGLGRRTLIYARTGKKRPHQKNQKRIKDFLNTLDCSRQLS